MFIIFIMKESRGTHVIANSAERNDAVSAEKLGRNLIQLLILYSCDIIIYMIFLYDYLHVL